MAGILEVECRLAVHLHWAWRCICAGPPTAWNKQQLVTVEARRPMAHPALASWVVVSWPPAAMPLAIQPSSITGCSSAGARLVQRFSEGQSMGTASAVAGGGGWAA